MLAPAILLVAGGCTRLLTGPAPDLYRLPAADAFPAGLPHVSVQLLVAVPEAPAGLDTRRIALSRSPISLDYFADSEWTDRVPTLVQTALIESFENSHTITAVGRDSIGLHADFILKSEIRRFEADYGAAGGPPTVWLKVVLQLVRMPAGEIIADTTLAARKPARANTVPDIVTAFAAAFDTLARQVILWTMTNPALSATHPSSPRLPSRKGREEG